MYTGRYTVEPIAGGVLIIHTGDPAEFAQWVRMLIARAQADRRIRQRGTVRPPAHPVDPLIVRLDALREQRNLSRQALGEVMSVGRSRLADYSTGRHTPRLDIVRAWAAALGRDLTCPPQPRKDR